MHSRYRLSEKTKKVYFSFPLKDTTFFPTWWTEGNRHDKTRSRHKTLFWLFNCQSTPTFRLISKSNTTDDVKACPRLVQPLRQGRALYGVFSAFALTSDRSLGTLAIGWNSLYILIIYLCLTNVYMLLCLADVADSSDGNNFYLHCSFCSGHIGWRWGWALIRQV